MIVDHRTLLKIRELMKRENNKILVLTSFSPTK